MELKYYGLYYSKSTGDSFNRTFMELKYSKTGRTTFGIIVLIVPLWNWNDRKRGISRLKNQF